MLALRRMTKLPANLDRHIEELAAGIEGLYGPAAGAEYRSAAPRIFQAAVMNPVIDVLAVWDGSAAAGLLTAWPRGGAGHIALIHVLSTYTDADVEERLVGECVRTFRAGGVGGIVFESVPLYEGRLDSTFEGLGFETIEREMMMAALDDVDRTASGEVVSEAFDESARPEAAAVIVAAYRDHPGRRLHAEVRDTEGASCFLERAAGDGYGPSHPDFIRGVWCEGALVGVVLGCRVAPGVGFILQVAVAPAFQGQGIGTALVRDLAREFQRAGMERMALGVTTTNPARRLYERLGFEPVRPVHAYAWWRP